MESTSVTSLTSITSSDEFWLESSHKGFDFSDVSTSSGDSKVSAFLKSNVSNQFTPLRYKGLDEVLESNSTSSTDSFNLIYSLGESSSQSSTTSEDYDPLMVVRKKKFRFARSTMHNVVRDMIFGLDYSLYDYKSKRDKIDLLKTALRTHDGFAILEVVLYLRDTLKKSIFQREIVAFPDALKVYLAYLEEDHKYDELTNTLLLADKAEDAAFLTYEAAVATEDPERRLHRIKNCLSTHFQEEDPDSYLSFYRYLVKDHSELLRKQIEFVKTGLVDFIGERGMTQFENLTGKKSLIDSSVMSSLIYSYIFANTLKYNDSEEVRQKQWGHMFTKPESVMLPYNLTKRQSTWAALRALGAVKNWDDLHDFFISKNWLGNLKIRSVIPLRRILEALSKAKAPPFIMSIFVSNVENGKEKLELAKKYACHDVVIEVLKQNKDRLGLLKYKSVLQPHSPDLIRLIETLHNPSIRWKN